VKQQKFTCSSDDQKVVLVVNLVLAGFTVLKPLVLTPLVKGRSQRHGRHKRVWLNVHAMTCVRFDRSVLKWKQGEKSLAGDRFLSQDILTCYLIWMGR
jgi:hypothetical protein